jgi:hypothetical protein
VKMISDDERMVFGYRLRLVKRWIV